MIRVRHFRFWLAVLLALATISPSWASPLLSFIARTDSGYDWIYRTADGHETVLYRGAEKPGRLFWSTDPATVTFITGNEVRRAAIAGDGAKVTSLGAVPMDHGPIEALWIDRASGRPRVAAMAPVAAKDVVRSGGRVTYRARDGKMVAGLSRPNWGLPFIATVLERDPAEPRWTVVFRAGTKSSAGDTPGLSVINSQKTEAGTAIDELLASYTCDSGQCRADVAPELAAEASRASGHKLTADDLSLWRPEGTSTTILFRTIMGDVAHMTTPVLLLGPSDPRMKPVAPADGRQIGLAPAGGLLLIADEFTGGHPVLIDLATGERVWAAPSATDAVWVPDGK